MSLLLRIFVPFAFGYYLSYVFRNVNAAIFRDLVADLGLGASDLGLLTSAYFFVFAAAQLPVGVLLDRYGPRRVNAALFLIAAAGAFGFTLGHTVTVLVISRALIGLGVSAGLMAAMKAFTDYFPIVRLPALNGMLMAIGGLGAMTATAPVDAALRLAGWRGLFFALGLLSLGVAAVILAVAPKGAPAAAGGAARRSAEGTAGESANATATRTGPAAAHPAAPQNRSTLELLRGVRAVLVDPFFWRVTAVSCTTLGPAMALQALWVAPWLRDVPGMDRATAARMLFLLTVALTAGFLASGKIVDWGRRIGLRMIDVMALASLLSALALAALAAGAVRSGVALWCGYIFAAAGATLAYPILAGRFPGALTGRVNASLNMATFVTAFAVQYGIGPVLDRWAGADGTWPPAAYGIAFGVIVALQGLALLAALPLLRRVPGAPPEVSGRIR